MFFLSILGVLSTPVLILIEALHTHFNYPNRIFTLMDIFNNSLLYIMLLTNMMIYVSITSYLFSREYSEHTLKTILPIPVSRCKFLLGKFLILFLWITFLMFTTWIGIFILSCIYNLCFNLSGFSLSIGIIWLFKIVLSGGLMFLVISPFAYIAEKSKGFVAPIIISAVIVMGSAALSNQDLGALYPYTAIYFLIEGKIATTGYPIILSVVIIMLISIIGFLLTFLYFKREDLK